MGQCENHHVYSSGSFLFLLLVAVDQQIGVHVARQDVPGLPGGHVLNGDEAEMPVLSPPSWVAVLGESRLQHLIPDDKYAPVFVQRMFYSADSTNTFAVKRCQYLPSA